MPLETRFWQKMVMLNYTHLYAFTAFYTIFLAVTLRATKSGRAGKILPVRVLIHRVSRPHIGEFVRLYANILAYFEKKYFFQILWPSSTGLQWVGSIMTVEGIAYRRRAKASTVGSESSGCRLSPPFAPFVRLIDGGRW